MFCLVGLAGLVGCFDVPEPPDPLMTSRVAVFDLPIGGRSSLDMLFVIDRSTAMSPYRQDLVTKISDFAAVLENMEGGLPDLNIAVASAHAGDGGQFRTSPHVDGSFVIDGMRDGVRVKNYTGSLGSVLSELADVGAAETAPPRPLDVVSAALAQPEFLREPPYLAIVLIAGADDASSAAIAETAATLKALKDDPARVVVIGVYPTGAPRLDALRGEFPNRSTFTAIDAADPSAGFLGLFRFTDRFSGGYCLDWTPTDVDPETPGDQLDCVVEEHDNATDTTSLLPRCAGDVTPCWDIRASFADCPGTRDGNYFTVDRGAEGLPYEGARIRGECRTD